MPIVIRLRAAVCIWALLLAPVVVADGESSATLKVVPSSGPPGSTVTIVLPRAATVSSVSFGSLKAVWGTVTPDVISAAVPNGSRPGTETYISIDTGEGRFLHKFRVTPPFSQQAYSGSLSIVGGSRIVTQGDFLELQLLRPPISNVPLTLEIAGTKTPPTVSGSTVRARVPAEIKPGDQLAKLTQGRASTFVAVTILEKRYFGIPQSRLVWVVMGAIVLAFFLYGAYQGWKTRRRFKQLARQYETVRSFDRNVEIADALNDGTLLAGPPTQIDSPEVPDELAEVCASGNCLLFAGPGLGAQALLPTRSEALLHLIKSSNFDGLLKSQLADALRAGQLAFVTEVLDARLNRDMIISELQLLYADDDDVQLSPAHKLLQKIPFAGVLTTGWDGLIERAFAQRKPMVITGESDHAYMQQHEAFLIARLNGDLYESESFVFSSEEYRRTLDERPTYAKFVASQVISRSLFFVGMSLSGIEEFFDAFRFSVRSSAAAKSYAILPLSPLWEAQQERFRIKYGVELIGYQTGLTLGHSELVKFLTKLEKKVSELAAPAAAASMSAAKLRRVALTNIGVFESLVLDDLQPGWNVLLGNNGTGKSTILKAIALGLCGDDPEAALSADRLLRFGARSGRIELTFGEVTYRTDLYREGDRCVVRSAQLTPLQKGNSVVLGFPPLRGVSLRDPSGVSPPLPSVPRVADVLPLIRGTIDTRLDSLKDWLVNLWADSNATDIPRPQAQRSARTIKAFVELLRPFVPGQEIGDDLQISRSPWRVCITTEDGAVPIESVSQGMSSIFGWAGTMIQRMFEIYPGVESPARQPAFVMVDEIDAHLHPEWQRKLASILTDQFPGAQILATTHSPLVIAGMKQKELFIALRDPADRSKVTISTSAVNPEGLRADQILTTPIFGLQSSRSPDVNRKISLYAELLGKKDRDEAEFEKLKKELAGMLLYGETEVERRAELEAAAQTREKIARLTADVASAPADIKEQLKQEL